MIPTKVNYVKHLRFLRGLWHHIGQVNQGRYPIYLDYAVQPKPRWGWGRPPHAELHDLIATGRERYAHTCSELEAFAHGLKRIPFTTTNEREPHWANAYMAGLDAATLYAFPKIFGSRRYLEVGSGNSTRFVRRSIDDHRLAMTITSIDPTPRAFVDEICDEVVRTGLEEAPLEIFDVLEADDILMLDGSHRCLQNSDVTVALLEILPRLRPGVIVFIHDIYLPYDYPAEWERRYYSEQYLLGAMLLADAGRRYEILFPAHFCTEDAQLGPQTMDMWGRLAPMDPAVRGSAFWLRIREGAETSPT
ncbi:MAG: class I SAM-dependent methyltransferase [Longimicrobiales bacterium]